jgi:hypothetical protein
VKLLLVLVLAICLRAESLLDGLPPDVAAQYHEIKSGRMRILYHRVDEGMARRLAEAVGVSSRRLADELDIRELPRASIVIAFDKDHFYRISGGSTPHWAGAVTLASRRLIVFRSPRWGDVGDDLSATMRHELAHLGMGLLHRGNWIPTWMEEGVAVVLSGLPRAFAPDGGRMGLSRAMATGSLLDLDEIESLHGFAGEQVGLAYMESESAVRFFLERYGRVSLVQLLGKVGRGTPFPQAFDEATGGGWFRFEEEWRDWLSDKGGLLFLTDIGSWIWILILLLALLAFLVKSLRNRKIRARWQAEEAARPLPDDWDD